MEILGPCGGRARAATDYINRGLGALSMGPAPTAARAWHGFGGAVRNARLRAIQCELLCAEHGQPPGGMAFQCAGTRCLQEGIRSVRSFSEPTCLTAYSRRRLGPESVQAGLRSVQTISSEHSGCYGLRGHGSRGRSHASRQGYNSAFARTTMGRVGSDLRVLWAWNWHYASLHHPWLDPSLHWQGGPLVPLERRGVRLYGPAVYPGPALGPRRSRPSLDSVFLVAYHPGVLVRGKTPAS